MDAVHRAAGGLRIDLVDIVDIGFQIGIAQVVQIDHDELFLLLVPICVDGQRVGVVRQRFPGFKGVLVLVRQDEDACGGFARAVRHIGSEGAGLAIIQCHGLNRLAGVQGRVGIHRVDVGAHGQRVFRLGRAVRRGDNNGDLLVAVVEGNRCLAVRQGLSVYRYRRVRGHGGRVNVYRFGAGRHLSDQPVGLAYGVVFTERMGRAEAGHAVFRIARCGDLEVCQLGNAGVVLAAQDSCFLAVHADEVAGAVIRIAVAREGRAVRAAGVAHGNAHGSRGAVVHDVLRRLDNRIQVADQVVDLIIVMAGPGDERIQIDFARGIERQHLVLEYLDAGQQHAHVVGSQRQRVSHAAAVAAERVGRIQDAMLLIEQQHAAGGVAGHIVVVQYHAAEVKLVAFLNGGEDVGGQIVAIVVVHVFIDVAQRHLHILFMDVYCAFCLDKVADLGCVVGMAVRDVQVDFGGACQSACIVVQAFRRARRHARVDQQRAVSALDQVHLVAVVVDDLPDLHAVLVIQQAALVLVLGHAVDRILEGYHIAVRHAFLIGISLEGYLGLLGCAVPTVAGVRADRDQFFDFRAARAGIRRKLGLVKYLGGPRGPGVAAIERVLDGRALGIREQRHILGHREGARGIRIKRVGVVVVIRVGIGGRNLIHVGADDRNRIGPGLLAVRGNAGYGEGGLVAGQLKHRRLAGGHFRAVDGDRAVGGSRRRLDFDLGDRIIHGCGEVQLVRRLAHRLDVVRILPVEVDAEVFILPQQVARYARQADGQVGQLCDGGGVAAVAFLGQEVRQVEVDARPVDVGQAVAHKRGAGVGQVVGRRLVAVQRAQGRGQRVLALVHDLLHSRLEIFKIGALAVQHNVVVAGQDVGDPAVQLLERDLQGGQVNVHRVRRAFAELHPEGVGQVRAVVAHLVGGEQVAGGRVKQHDACDLVARHFNDFKFHVAQRVDVAVGQGGELVFIRRVRFFLGLEHACCNTLFLDVAAQGFNTALVDIDLCAQRLIFLAQELERHLHMVRVRVADDQVDRLAFADDLTRCRVQVGRCVRVKVARIEHHGALRTLDQIHLVAVIVLDQPDIFHLVAVPVERRADFQLAARLAGYRIVPAGNLARAAVAHGNRLDVVGLFAGLVFLFRGRAVTCRLLDHDLLVLIGIELFAVGRRVGGCVLAFRDLIIDVCAFLSRQRDIVGHVVVKYAQALGGFLALGQRVCIRCVRGGRAAGAAGRAAGRTAGRAAGALGLERRGRNLNRLPVDGAAQRGDRAGIAAQDQVFLDGDAVQRNAGGLDDYNTVPYGGNRPRLGDVIRNHVIQHLDHFCTGDVSLRIKQVAALAVYIALLLERRNIGRRPGGNAAAVGKACRTAAARYRKRACQHAHRFLTGDRVVRPDLPIVAFHYARGRYAQHRIGVVSRTEVGKRVFRLLLIVHDPVNNNRHIPSGNRGVRLEVIIVALDHAVSAPLVNDILRPVSLGVAERYCACQGEHGQQHCTGKDPCQYPFPFHTNSPSFLFDPFSRSRSGSLLPAQGHTAAAPSFAPIIGPVPYTVNTQFI